MAYILLIFTTLFWSGNFVISRGMHSYIPPISLSFWRWFVALLVLSIFATNKLWQHKSIIRSNFSFIVLQGLVGVAGFNTLIYLAIQSTTAINAVLVNSCIPVLIALCSWFMYGERLNFRQSTGVILSLCGVVLIIIKGDLSLLLSLQLNKGDMIVLLAAFLWAFYSANLKKYPEGLHPLAYLMSIVLVGLVFLIPLYLVERVIVEPITISPQVIVTVLYVAVFASVLAFIFWNRAVREIGANRAGPFIHLMPVFSTILAVLFLHERFYLFHLVGIVLIFTGISMTNLRKNRKKGDLET